MLAAEGVETVLGIIDGTYFRLWSNFEIHGIRPVSPCHETSGVQAMFGLEKRRRLVLPGMTAKTACWTWRYAPALFERLMRSRITEVAA